MSASAVLVLAACSNDVRIASDFDSDTFERFCKARCAFERECADRNEESCLDVCLDFNHPWYGQVRTEYIAATAECFEGLSCSQRDDECEELSLPLPPAPELYEVCDACVVDHSDCVRGLPLTDARRQQARDCLLELCAPSCLPRIPNVFH